MKTKTSMRPKFFSFWDFFQPKTLLNIVDNCCEHLKCEWYRFFGIFLINKITFWKLFFLKLWTCLQLFFKNSKYYRRSPNKVSIALFGSLVFFKNFFRVTVLRSMVLFRFLWTFLRDDGVTRRLGNSVTSGNKNFLGTKHWHRSKMTVPTFSPRKKATFYQKKNMPHVYVF
jgi:hypothetical protein